ncbi:MAG: hypothetical protein ACP5IL_03245 [Syntrophobacteraceae bacterium]
MKTIVLALLTALMLTACSNLPQIRTDYDKAAAARMAACKAIFPHGKWQLEHSLEIFPPVGSKQTVLGIVRLDSAKRTFHCVLMTIEGLVLFEADFDGKIKIARALPPLDKPGMAEGIVRDISFLFLAPKKPCIAAGFSKDGDWVCRYRRADREYEDIVLKAGGLWQIRVYNQSERLIRTISPVCVQQIKAGALPRRVRLKAYGLGGYELSLTLIEAIPLKKPIPAGSNCRSLKSLNPTRGTY